jgi:hypothetical protein
VEARLDKKKTKRVVATNLKVESIWSLFKFTNMEMEFETLGK